MAADREMALSSTSQREGSGRLPSAEGSLRLLRKLKILILPFSLIFLAVTGSWKAAISDGSKDRLAVSKSDQQGDHV